MFADISDLVEKRKLVMLSQTSWLGSFSSARIKIMVGEEKLLQLFQAFGGCLQTVVVDEGGQLLLALGLSQLGWQHKVPGLMGVDRRPKVL
jgi:hypothetical protein